MVHQGRYLQFRVDTIERADGSRSTRDIAGHPGAVAMVALDEQQRVLLVRQFRLAAGRVLLEIPAGTLDRDDAGAIEAPDLAAARELEEETGTRAGTWEHIADFYTAPGFTEELMHLYLATDLRPADDDASRLGPDEDEHLLLERRPWRDALEAIDRGEIVDAKSIVGLLWLARRMGGDEGPRTTAGDPTVQGPATAPGAASDGPFEPSPRVGDQVTIEFELRPRDQLFATMAVVQRSKITWAFTVLAILGGLAAIVERDPFTAAYLIPVGILMGTGLLAAPFVWWQGRQRPDLVGAAVRVTADAAGVTWTTVFGMTHQTWATYRRVREAGGYFFLDTGSGTNQLIPRRAFDPTQLATFHRLLDRSGLLGRDAPTAR